MALFSTLASDSTSNDLISSSPTPKSLDIVTVVQLFTDQPFPLTLDTAHHHQGYTASISTTPPSYATLHYTAVQCQTASQLENALEQQQGLRQLSRKALVPATPDLGVWNFRVSSRNTPSQPEKQSSTDSLLLPLIVSDNGSGAIRTFCMVVDLSILENVEPSVSQMQEALVRLLIQVDKEKWNTEKTSESDPIRSTTLFQLRKAQFGLAPLEDSSTDVMTKSEPDPDEVDVAIALQICVKLPGNSLKFQDYRDQQAVALIVYHLRRYAAALSASLLFVRGVSIADKSKTKDGPMSELILSPSKSNDSTDSPAFHLLQEQPTVPIQQLPIVWRELAQRKPVWDPSGCPEIYEDLAISSVSEPAPEEEGKSTDENNIDTTVAAHSLIYGPGVHNEDLIESVLLRNAHYPGYWDAGKDSLWKILPKNSSQAADSSATSKKKIVKSGDDWWLGELRESIAIPETMKTPPPKKAADAAPSTSKTPNDAAVSSFFEDLLK
jgi:hypothetical protein